MVMVKAVSKTILMVCVTVSDFIHLSRCENSVRLIICIILMNDFRVIMSVDQERRTKGADLVDAVRNVVIVLVDAVNESNVINAEIHCSR